MLKKILIVVGSVLVVMVIFGVFAQNKEREELRTASAPQYDQAMSGIKGISSRDNLPEMDQIITEFFKAYLKPLASKTVTKEQRQVYLKEVEDVLSEAYEIS